jgi:hypothetical protein
MLKVMRPVMPSNVRTEIKFSVTVAIVQLDGFLLQYFFGAIDLCLRHMLQRCLLFEVGG